MPGQRGINLPFAQMQGNDKQVLQLSNLASHTHPAKGEVFIGATDKDDASSDSPKDSHLSATPGQPTYASGT
ncbi:hypothetical protein [Flavobacterium sp. 3HN19-14]|uniref:hypothetical protein n=1 Tax=Flavobacterium sp. 3HN19-14 TaxID=3448133 RepID=UPI003EE27E1A